LKIISLLLSIILILSACTKNTHRYTKTTINPELLGKWQSMDGCYLTLAKNNNSLVLVDYHDHKNHHLHNLKLNFKIYSIETILTNNETSNLQFKAKYIDGMIIIESDCGSPLQKVTNKVY
jgi:hypothetical protein